MAFLQKLKLNFLCFIGYVYFLAVLLLIVLLLLALMGAALSGKGLAALFKLSIPLAVFFWAVFKGFFKAIFTKLPEPYGIELGSKEYPEIYRFIQKIRISAKCPRIHSVKIDFDSNAYIAEIPRVGIIGLRKRYLVIGLPLMLSLSEPELAAVIAHECGHLSKAHGKTGIRIYRAKTVWEKISEELKKSGKDKVFLIRIFINRYVTAITDMYYRVSRQQEYEADRTAAGVTGNAAVASSLIKITLFDSYLDNIFWPEIRKLNENGPDVPVDIMIRQEKALSNQLSQETCQRYVEAIIKIRSLPGSTHPSYIERLEALNAKIPEIPEVAYTAQNSVRSIFGEKAESVLSVCSREWADKSLERWKGYFEYYNTEREKLENLNTDFSQDRLELDGMLERAALIEQLAGADDALLALQEVKQKYPDNANVDYKIGKLLIHMGKEEGADLLKDIIKREFQLIPACSYELMNHYCSCGDRDEAAEYYHLAVQVMETNEEIKNERENVRLNDEYIANDLSYDSVMNIISCLKKYKGLKKVYVVIKHTEASEQFPIYIIGVRYKLFYSFRWRKVQDELLKAGLLPWEHWVINLNKNRGLEYRFDRIPMSRIL